MRARFVMSETGIGLRRHPIMTVAVVLTFTISLALLSGALLLRAQVNAMKDYWYGKVEVSIFLCGTDSGPNCPGPVTEAQRQQIYADLAALPQVEHVYYESQQQAYAHFQQQFKGTAIAQNITPDALPESYRVKLRDPTQYALVATAFTGRPGVEQVQDERALLDKLFKIIDVVQWFFLLVAVILVVATALLIVNSIQVSAFSRRRETGIMKLVGASSFYIQLPFVLEGLIAAMVGWALAAVSAFAIKGYLVDHVIAPNYPFTSFFGWSAVWGTVIFTLIVGIVLGGVSSYLTTLRYVRV